MTKQLTGREITERFRNGGELTKEEKQSIKRDLESIDPKVLSDLIQSTNAVLKI